MFQKSGSVQRDDRWGCEGRSADIRLSGWLLFTRKDVDDDLIYRITKIVIENKHLFEMSFKGLPLEKVIWSIPLSQGKFGKTSACRCTLLLSGIIGKRLHDLIAE